MSIPTALQEQRFYDSRWASSELSEKDRKRISETAAAVPSDCKSILDLGCGDGRLTRHLAEVTKARIIGCDLSPVALAKLNLARCCGSADALPFADRAVDMVLTTEILEHIPPQSYQGVLDEISRVAGKYILVTVPHSENLLENTGRCGACGKRFHIWGHQRSYSAATLQTMFKNFHPLRVMEIGEPTAPYNRALLTIRENVADAWAWDEDTSCYFCGNPRPVKPRFPLLARVCDFLNYRFFSKLSKHPSWYLALFARR